MYIVQVELKCTEPTSGGYYYPEHLPLLGEWTVNSSCSNPFYVHVATHFMYMYMYMYMCTYIYNMHAMYMYI